MNKTGSNSTQGGSSGGQPDQDQQSGAGSADTGGGQGGAVPEVGAGAGKPPGTPGGNGTKDEPIWGS